MNHKNWSFAAPNMSVNIVTQSQQTKY